MTMRELVVDADMVVWDGTDQVATCEKLPPELSASNGDGWQVTSRVGPNFRDDSMDAVVVVLQDQLRTRAEESIS